MPDASRALVSFNAGEVSPDIWSRVDLAKAASSCRKVENMIVETYGIARRRPGTKFVAQTGNPAINPKGPPGVTVVVNRHTDSLGHPLPPDDSCLKLVTWFEVTILSLTGSGCLCGYDEYVDGAHSPPIIYSSPRKKYRRKTLGGETYVFESGVSCFVDDGHGRARDTYSGFAEYDAFTCIIDDQREAHSVLEGCYGTSDTTVHGEPISSARVQAHVQSTTRVLFYGIGCNLGLCALGTLPNFADPDKIASIDLDEEDKMSDALARAVHTEGSSLTATLVSFNDANCCFTATAVLYLVHLHGLTIDCSYQLTVDHQRNNGSGGITSVQEVFTFTAGETDFVFSADVPTVVGGWTTLAGVLLEKV